MSNYAVTPSNLPILTLSKKLWREIKRSFQQVGHWIKSSLQNLMGYNDLTEFIQRSISTAALHQKTFSKFKNIHQGQEIVLVACGPTAKDYKRIDGAIHIGVNRAFRLENIDLHYLFIQDYHLGKSCLQAANQYKPESCKKFYGLIDHYSDHIIPESDASKANALRYRTDYMLNYKKSQFRYFIDSEPLGDFGSVAFSAIQFALWTNPRTIYLIGCDCSEGYFDGQASTMSATHLVLPWIQLKEFAHVYYPETEIKSIYPIGLKGLFDEHKQV